MTPLWLSPVVVAVIAIGGQLGFGQLFFEGNVPDWVIKTSAKTTGSRLILTSIIDAGNDLRARHLARVNPKLFLGVTSYSGYFTVDEGHNSNLFFWFFPCEGTEHQFEEDLSYVDEYDEDDFRKEPENGTTRAMPPISNEIPIVLWLQGGPGASSLFGLFTENGPFFVNSDGISIRKNPFSWHTKYHMLFIDNPVGAGFSFTNPSGYVNNVTQATHQLNLGLVQFFKMFPWLQSAPFYISGESYAGKYIPALAYEIVFNNNQDNGDFRINLQGVMIGNGFTDPYHMSKYSDFVYQAGLVDYHGRNEMQVFETLARENIYSKEAKVYWDSILYTFIKYSNFSHLYNIQEGDYGLESYLDFINQNHIRKALHVGPQEFGSIAPVYHRMSGDFMSSAMHYVEYLLDQHLRIMFYSGNMDIIVAYPLSENSFHHMRWNKTQTYRLARRKEYRVDGKLAGYVKKVANFHEVVVLNAGHMVPTDQPKTALKLMDDFIYDRL